MRAATYWEVYEMASVHREVVVDAQPDHVWAAIRDFGAVARLVTGFVVDCRLEAEQNGGARIVTFADGREARELLVDLDDARRRLHHAQRLGSGVCRGRRASRVVWIIDVLPNEFAGLMVGNMDKATAIMKRTLEASAQG